METVTHNQADIDKAADLANLDFSGEGDRINAFLKILELIENRTKVEPDITGQTEFKVRYKVGPDESYAVPVDATRCNYNFPLRCTLLEHDTFKAHRFDITTIPGETIGGRSEHDTLPTQGDENLENLEEIRQRDERTVHAVAGTQYSAAYVNQLIDDRRYLLAVIGDLENRNQHLWSAMDNLKLTYRHDSVAHDCVPKEEHESLINQLDALAIDWDKRAYRSPSNPSAQFISGCADELRSVLHS